MKFNEQNYIDLTNVPKSFIYFLLDGNDVVYIGQTTIGLQRVYTHYKDKQFNKIYIKECDVSELDYVENMYIQKYQPKYNKQLNLNLTYSVKRVAKILNKKFTKRYSYKHVELFCDYLNIDKINYRNNNYIRIEDVDLIINHIKENGGRC